jgi:hypothetical protein
MIHNIRLIHLKGAIGCFGGSKNPTRQIILLKKVFLHKLDFFIFHALCLAGSNGLFVCHPLSSFPLVVGRPISCAVIVHHCHPLLLSLSALAVVLICRHCCCRPPPSLSTAAIFRLRSRHCHSVSLPSLAACSCPSPL